jgi:hypothetical protein
MEVVMFKILIRNNVMLMGLFVFSLILSSCANYNIAKNGDGSGYDIFKPEPYLLLKQNEKGLNWEVIWLPNYKERYRINSRNFLSKADFQFDIENGWLLTKITDKSDNTTILSEALKLSQGFFSGTKKAEASNRGSQANLSQVVKQSPKLFRFIFDESGVINGLKEIKLITD